MQVSGTAKYIGTAKNIPVNYRIRYSGPVTPLTARRVWYGVGALSICPDPLAGVLQGWSWQAFDAKTKSVRSKRTR